MAFWTCSEHVETSHTSHFPSTLHSLMLHPHYRLLAPLPLSPSSTLHRNLGLIGLTRKTSAVHLHSCSSSMSATPRFMSQRRSLRYSLPTARTQTLKSSLREAAMVTARPNVFVHAKSMRRCGPAPHGLCTCSRSFEGRNVHTGARCGVRG